MLLPCAKTLVLAGLALAGPALGQAPAAFPAFAGAATVPVVKVSSGRVIHRFFDTSPMSPSGRYLALFRFPEETRAPKPGEVGEVVLVDRQTGKERVVAKSRGWEMQLGANVQWGATDQDLYFNDVDTTTWQAYAVRLNPSTGQARRMGGTVFMASNDGQYLASYNLISSRYAQVGYGVVIPDAQTPHNYGPVATDGIDVTNTATGVSKRIVTIRDIYEKAMPSLAIPNPNDFEYYCFQVKWNPQGTRLLTTLQWAPKGGGPRQRSVVTMRTDGSDLRTAITPAQWARGGHHVNWTPDGEHLSMNLEVDGKPGLEIITVRYDGTDFKTVFTPGSGHPSFNPTGPPLMVTDAYPGELGYTDGTVPIRLLNTASGQEEAVANIYVSKTGGELRIDPHPAWDRTGRYVIFNGFEGNTRGVYLADLAGKLQAAKKKKNLTSQ